MKASARIVVEAGSGGASRLAVCSGEAPLLPRRTSRYGPLEVHLVGGAAGPLRGDDLCLRVEVGPGASLVLRTVASTVALAGPSRMTVQAVVEAGGKLEYLPEPVVASAVCDHVMRSTVELDATARLVWREELVCGRYGEEPGDLVSSTTVRRAGVTLFRQEIAVGPRTPAWYGPAMLGGARTMGSILVVDPEWTVAPTATATTAIMPLAGPAVLITAVADHAHDLRRTLDELARLSEKATSP